MKRIAIVAASTVILLSPVAWAATNAPTGRWYKECGGDLYCRVYVEKAGARRFNFHFMTTSPKSAESCEWISVLRLRDDGRLASTGQGANFEVWIDKTGALRTAGVMPAKCGTRPDTDTFKPDDADENGDF
jgi:hypothetical protein